MLLAIDIGNTNIKLAAFDGERIAASDRILSGGVDSPLNTSAALCDWLGRHTFDEHGISGVVFSSVVPPLSKMIEQAAEDTFGIAALDIKQAPRQAITLDVDKPDGVGTDRIANAAAGYGLYGGPCIVVDFGTATTFDVVTRDGVFIGGVIAPGIALASEALTSRAAQLPPIEPVFPPRVIGRDTDQAMRAGLMYGYLELVEGVIRRIQHEIGSPARVIGTGGLAGTLAGQTTLIDGVEPDLTLHGLRFIWEMNHQETGAHDDGMRNMP